MKWFVWLLPSKDQDFSLLTDVKFKKYHFCLSTPSNSLREAVDMQAQSPEKFMDVTRDVNAIDVDDFLSRSMMIKANNKITCYLKEDQSEFLEERRQQDLVNEFPALTTSEPLSRYSGYPSMCGMVLSTWELMSTASAAHRGPNYDLMWFWSRPVWRSQALEHLLCWVFPCVSVCLQSFLFLSDDKAHALAQAILDERSELSTFQPCCRNGKCMHTWSPGLEIRVLSTTRAVQPTRDVIYCERTHP